LNSAFLAGVGDDDTEVDHTLNQPVPKE
jgi:hypothetical protein